MIPITAVPNFVPRGTQAEGDYLDLSDFGATSSAFVVAGNTTLQAGEYTVPFQQLVAMGFGVIDQYNLNTTRDWTIDLKDNSATPANITDMKVIMKTETARGSRVRQYFSYPVGPLRTGLKNLFVSRWVGQPQDKLVMYVQNTTTSTSKTIDFGDSSATIPITRWETSA